MPQLREIRVGLIGCGVVGGGLLKLLQRHAAQLSDNGLRFAVNHIAVRDPARPRGADLSRARVCTDRWPSPATPKSTCWSR